MQLEYTYLLTSQLESQRHYFESKLAKAEEQSRKETAEIRERAKELAEENETLSSKLAAANAERRNHERKTQSLAAKVTKLTQDLADEKQMNSCLRSDKVSLAASVEQLKKDAEARDVEIADLREQLRDILFHLEAQRKVEGSAQETKDELQTGQILMPEGATGGGSSGKNRRKRSNNKN